MSLVINTDNLFDGTRIIEGASVLIRDGRITGLDRKGKFNGEGLQEIESEFVMPGLIDMHVHVYGVSENWNDFIGPLENYLNLLLYNGVTTVRDTGNFLEYILHVRALRQRNPAPLIFSSGPILDEPPLRWPHSRAVTSREDAKSQVNRLSVEGVDLVKAYANVRPDTLKWIVEEAHARGLKVAGHLGATRATDAIDIGVDSLEHAFTLIDESFIDDQSALKDLDQNRKLLRIWSTVDLNSDAVRSLTLKIAQSNVYLCPTLVVGKRLSSAASGSPHKDPASDYMELVLWYFKYTKRARNPFYRFFASRFFGRNNPFEDWDKNDRQRATEGYRKTLELVGKLFKTNCKIIAGTDTANPFIVPGFSLQEELGLYVEAGASPIQALASATSIPGQALGRSDIGTISRGSVANLVLGVGNPSKEISDLKKISGVVLEGKPLKTKEIGLKLGISY